MSYLRTGHGRTETIIKKLTEHINRVSRLPGMENAQCVLAIESNYGNDADWIHSALQHHLRVYPASLPRLHFLTDDGTSSSRHASTIGILADDKTKANMARMLEIAVDARAVAFHSNFTSAKTTPRDQHEVRKTLVTQLCNYERIIEARVGNPLADPRIIYSGKRHGPDDLAICMQLNLLAQDRYRRQRQRLQQGRRF